MSNGIQTSQRLHESHRKQATEQENEILRAELAALRKRVAELEKEVRYRDDIIGLLPNGNDRHSALVAEIERLRLENRVLAGKLHAESRRLSQSQELVADLKDAEDAATESFEELLTWNIEASVELKKCRARLAEYEEAMEGVTVEDLYTVSLGLLPHFRWAKGRKFPAVGRAIFRLANLVAKKEEADE